MEFKKPNVRGLILISTAGLILCVTVVSKISSQHLLPDQSISSDPSMAIKPSVSDTGLDQAQRIAITHKERLTDELTEEDTQSIKEMKEQMDNDRLQQKKIKMLKLQLEQTNLQLEQEKAKSEIDKLEKENTGVVNDSDSEDQDKYPEVKVVYIGGSDKERQAILAINGNSYLVKEKNRPIKNMEVISISNTAVTLHFNLPQDLDTSIEYKAE